MTTLRVDVDMARLRADLTSEQERLKRVARRVAYELAHRSADAVRAEMQAVFDRPTPYVLRGVYVAPLADENSATVDWRPGSLGAIPTEKILRAQVEGGPRRFKRFEKMLGLPNSHKAVPGRWARLDAYGNISGSQIVSILSALRAFPEVGYTANINRAREAKRYARALRAGREPTSRQTRTYFMVPVGNEEGNLPPGVYRRAPNFGGAPLLIIAFVRDPVYRVRLTPVRVVQEIVARQANEVWNLGLSRQLPFRR